VRQQPRRLGQRRWWARVNAPLLAAVAATLVCAALYEGHQRGALSIPGLEELELGSVDVRFRLRGARAPRSDDIVIVGLDDATRVRAP
jgi:CHASE2 domain-containing sensor protein